VIPALAVSGGLSGVLLLAAIFGWFVSLFTSRMPRSLRQAELLRGVPRELLTIIAPLLRRATQRRARASLDQFLRDDARTRAELEARQGWTVNAARLALAAPWAVLALLALRPEAVVAYDSAAGSLVLLVGGLVSIAAYRLMLRVARLPEEERVLR